jgi:predicted nucleic acid-binding protein
MAYIQGEPAAESVKKVLSDANENKCHVSMSIINIGEVLYNIERNKGLDSAQDILSLIQTLPIEILPADNETVFAAAHIKANHLLSYADAFVVVAAQKINGIIMTGDPEFEAVAELAQIEWLKKRS